MSRESLLTALYGGAFALVVYVALAFRRRSVQWEMKANLWFHRATALGWDDYANYPITEAQAEKIMRDLFPRPMGAPVVSPNDVRLARESRRHRALFSRDHNVRHFAEGVTDSEVAREILQFTVGGYEVDE